MLLPHTDLLLTLEIIAGTRKWMNRSSSLSAPLPSLREPLQRFQISIFRKNRNDNEMRFSIVLKP